MSKKKTLSPTASLASCLDFAARVLSSTATVQEMCTKQVLAPMVVEAHRCGQQVMKYVDPGIPADVRKLIKVLQSEKDSNLCRGPPLEELEVADLTWDAEGIVADTLEMELVELEKRVVNAQDACVIFSTSGGNGQAVIWFSFKRYESLHKGSNARNRQILLYVCPGRVKVVKSVDALITKLYEELASLRMNGATYNVWTVVMGSKSSNQKEEQRVDLVASQKALNGTSNQCADKDALNILSTRTTVAPEPSSCERTNHLDEIARSAESRRSNSTLCTQETGVGPQLCTTQESVETAPESQDDKCDPVFSRCSVYRETSDTKPFPVKSIFSFGLQQRTSQELQRRSFEQNPSYLNATDENGKGTVDLDPDSINVEGESASISNPEVEVESRGDNQIQDTRSIRAVVSSSLANFSTLDNGGIPDGTALGLGIKLKEGFVWQSCDGKVLRKTIRKRELPLPSVEAMESEIQIEVEAARYEDQPDAHAGDDEEVAACTSNNLLSDEMQKPQNMPQSKVSSVDDKLDSLHISTSLHEPNVDQDRDDHQSVGSSQNSEVVMQVTSSVTPSTKSTSPDSESVNDESINGVVGEPLQTNDLLTGFVGDCDKTEDHSIAPSEILQVNNDDLMHRPKSAVNYKDKLGARIWWELAYTARRLEREEMMEKNQQALRPAGDQRVNRQQPATTNGRRVEPTLSRNEELMGSHKELTVPNDQSCVDQQIPKEVDTVERQSANNYLDVPERPLDYSSATSASSIKKETSPSKIVIPSPSREALSGSSVNGVDKFVTSRSLSVQNVVDDGDSGTTAMQEEVEEVVVECPPSTISSAASCSPIRKTYRSLDQRRESNPAMRESSTPSVAQLSTPPSLETRIEEGDSDDETVAQMMWGSTHTSYERERHTDIYRAAKEDELQTTEAISKIPFIIRGRVPIRSRPVKTPARGEPSRSSYSELTPPFSNLDHITGADQSQDMQIPSRIKLPVNQASTDYKTQPVVPAPPVATFIPLSEENIAATSDKTRQERLNDLRQKKLQKLQQARDSSLQLQKEKQSQQTRQPLSFANAIYTKKASNRQLMQNALEFTLLAGRSMEKERLLALQALAESTCDNFIVLLKSAKELKFRALYESHVDRDYATRIFSVLPSTSARAPLKLTNSEMISQFFKYSSAKKQFLLVPTRSFTVKTDACALVDQLVFKKNSSSALARLL